MLRLGLFECLVWIISILQNLSHSVVLEIVILYRIAKNSMICGRARLGGMAMEIWLPRVIRFTGVVCVRYLGDLVLDSSRRSWQLFLASSLE